MPEQESGYRPPEAHLKRDFRKEPFNSDAPDAPLQEGPDTDPTNDPDAVLLEEVPDAPLQE